MEKKFQIPRKDIKYRVGNFKSKKKTFATFLVYIDARTAMDGLDHLYGVGGWSFDWSVVEGTQDTVKSKMTVFVGDDSIVRHDVGYSNSSGEPLKDAVSDSLKRVAVQFGVGRELYSAPFLYTEELNTYKDSRTQEVKINSYNPLNDVGKKIVEGNIDKWHGGLYK